MEHGIAAINEQVKRESEFVRLLVGEIAKVIVGQSCFLVDFTQPYQRPSSATASRAAGRGWLM